MSIGRTFLSYQPNLIPEVEQAMDSERRRIRESEEKNLYEFESGRVLYLNSIGGCEIIHNSMFVAGPTTTSTATEIDLRNKVYGYYGNDKKEDNKLSLCSKHLWS